MSSKVNELIAKSIAIYYYPSDKEVEIRAQKRNGVCYKTIVEQETKITFMSRRRWDVFKSASELLTCDEYVGEIASFIEAQPREVFESHKYMLVPCSTKSYLKGNRIKTRHQFAVSYIVNDELFIDFYYYDNNSESEKASEMFKVDFSKFVEV